MNSTIKTLLLWAIIFVVVILVWNTLQSGRTNEETLTYTEFLDQLDRGNIDEIHIKRMTVDPQKAGFIDVLVQVIEPVETLPEVTDFPERTPMTALFDEPEPPPF